MAGTKTKMARAAGSVQPTKLNDRQNVFHLMPNGQPIGLIDNVIDAGTMFADFTGTRGYLNGTPTVSLTRDYTGMDPVTGAITGIPSRTGIPSMLMMDIQQDATFSFMLNNATLGNVTTGGIIGMWVYADLSAKATGTQQGISLNLFNIASFGSDAMYVAYNANQIRHGWNFLAYAQRDTIANLPASDTHFLGLVVQKFGTGLNGDIKTGQLKCIQIDITGLQGCKLYFDSMWCNFSTKPQFVIGVDLASSDTINYALPKFQQHGWVGYVANPRRVFVSGSKVISDWTNSGHADTSRMRTLYDAGWDIINHTTNHYNLATETNPAAIRYEIEGAKSWYLQNGFVRGTEFYASPQSGSSLLAEKVIADCGIKLQRHARHSNVQITPFGIDNPAHVGAIDMGSNGSGYQKFSKLKAWIDNIVLYGATGFPFFHNITTLGDTGTGEDLTGSDLVMTKSAFDMTMDYIKSLEAAGKVNVCRGMSGFWYGA